MMDMLQSLKKIYAKNQDLIEDQHVVQGRVPDRLLMIDGVHEKPLSPQMRLFYDFAAEWKSGIMGFDVVNPGSLRDLYGDERIRRTLELHEKYLAPIPPSDPSDPRRTAIFAVEAGGHDLCFYWWEADDDVEPCVIYISGGTVDFFADLNELVAYLAEGTFPEKGDEIYTRLEDEREAL